MSNVAALLAPFEAAAQNPKKQMDAYIAQGKKVVGCGPVYSPEELVYAAGMVPFALWGAEVEISESKKYFPAFYCAIAQTILEQGLTGQLDGLSALIVSGFCDTLKCLGQNWKVGVKEIPMIYLMTPQHRKMQAGIDFLAGQYRKIGKQLSDISGTEVTNDNLQAAIKVYNEHRALMREFSALASVHPKSVSPLQRSAVMKSAHFMLKDEHSELLKALNAELKAMPEEDWDGKRVFVTGIVADQKQVLTYLAENNMALAGDEVAAESRQWRTDVPADADAFVSLAKLNAEMEGCSVLYDPEKKRADMIVDMARERKADGIICLMTKFCDPEEFDYPILKAAFDDAGIPSVSMEVDLQMKNYEQVKTALETFRDVLGA